MVSDWNAHAEKSDLAKLVKVLRPNEYEKWLQSATPRLPETIRLNPLRKDHGWTVKRLLEMGATPITWYTGSGGAYSLPWEKGRCPDNKIREQIQSLHATGRITQQEAASMMPVQALDVQPGHRVLDLCAAPGSKSTQIAESLHGKGLLVASEPNPGRVNNLVSNIHRTGHLNVVVAKHDGRHFPRVAKPGFDRVLVDVPCTGTGTTRKNTDVWTKWNLHSGRGMHKLQVDILKKGALLLRPGGKMVYSTCSIDPIENEAVVASILKQFPWLELISINTSDMFPDLRTRNGYTDWPLLDGDGEISEPKRNTNQDFQPPLNSEIKDSLVNCIRVWSDENDGSGFFLAVFGQTDCDHDCARATRTIPRTPGHIPKPISAPKLGNNELRKASEEEIEYLNADWDIDLNELTLWRRGPFVHVSSSEITEWMWASKRTTAKFCEYPGEHWHPVRVAQAGQPAWKLRKGRSRLLSKGLYGIGGRVSMHRHQISKELLIRLLDGEEPGKSTIIDDFPSFENERDGGVLLEVIVEGEIESCPAWIAGKLSLMMPDAEKFVLKWRLGCT